MKKVLAVILAASMIFVLSACGKQTAKDKNESDSKSVAEIRVGEYVKFGSYEQDNDTTNGKENIEWLVLEVRDGKALVISKYALEEMPYDNEVKNTTWETCSLREWLNNDFVDIAFTEDENELITRVEVSADKTSNQSTNPGNATQDKLFLLSYTEASTYFDSDSARQCKATKYAVANGAFEDENGKSVWWLRSPGAFQYRAVFVLSDGSVYERGLAAVSSCAVRPAMWIDIESSTLQSYT